MGFYEFLVLEKGYFRNYGPRLFFPAMGCVGILCTLANCISSRSSLEICISFFKNCLSFLSVSLGDSSSESLIPKNLILLRRLWHSCLIIRRSSWSTLSSFLLATPSSSVVDLIYDFNSFTSAWVNSRLCRNDSLSSSNCFILARICSTSGINSNS